MDTKSHGLETLLGLNVRDLAVERRWRRYLAIFEAMRAEVPVHV